MADPMIPEDVQAALRWLVAVEDHIYKGLRERYHENLALVQAHIAARAQAPAPAAAQEAGADIVKATGDVDRGITALLLEVPVSIVEDIRRRVNAERLVHSRLLAAAQDGARGDERALEPRGCPTPGACSCVPEIASGQQTGPTGSWLAQKEEIATLRAQLAAAQDGARVVGEQDAALIDAAKAVERQRIANGLDALLADIYNGNQDAYAIDRIEAFVRELRVEASPR